MNFIWLAVLACFWALACSLIVLALCIKIYTEFIKETKYREKPPSLEPPSAATAYGTPTLRNPTTHGRI